MIWVGISIGFDDDCVPGSDSGPGSRRLWRPFSEYARGVTS